MQQGGELAYLIRHDPEFRGVRREHLVEAGRRVRLKAGLQRFVEFLARGIEGNQFSFYVVSAAPREVVVSALDGIVPAENIFGTEFDYDPHTGEVRSIDRVRAGYGKVAVLDELGSSSASRRTGLIYVGDGSSDIHVMLHVNNGDGFTIAVSENRQLARIARSTVLSDNAGSVLVPILDQVLGLRGSEIRAQLESTGLVIGRVAAGADRPCADPRIPARRGAGLSHGHDRCLGWVATAVFVSSYFFKRPAWLRAAQMIGACAVDRVRRDDRRDPGGGGQWAGVRGGGVDAGAGAVGGQHRNLRISGARLAELGRILRGRLAPGRGPA